MILNKRLYFPVQEKWCLRWARFLELSKKTHRLQWISKAEEEAKKQMHQYKQSDGKHNVIHATIPKTSQLTTHHGEDNALLCIEGCVFHVHARSPNCEIWNVWNVWAHGATKHQSNSKRYVESFEQETTASMIASFFQCDEWFTYTLKWLNITLSVSPLQRWHSH